MFGRGGEGDEFVVLEKSERILLTLSHNYKLVSSSSTEHWILLTLPHDYKLVSSYTPLHMQREIYVMIVLFLMLLLLAS